MISPMHDPVVSNTSPLLNLAIIGQLHLLFQQFDKVVIPTAVHRELQLETNLPGTYPLQQAIIDGYLQVSEVKNIHLVQVLQIDLDKGEAEAIALALENNTKRILLDETDGRLAAKLLNLQPTGVLGILLRAKKSGKISDIEPLINKLRNDAGFFIAAQLYDQILLEAGEG